MKSFVRLEVKGLYFSHSLLEGGLNTVMVCQVLLLLGLILFLTLLVAALVRTGSRSGVHLLV